MSDTLAAALISVVLITVGAFAFWVLIDVWDIQNEETVTALVASRSRLDTHLAISSAESASLGCGTFSVSVDNTGHTSVSAFSNMDVVADYTDTSGDRVLTHLAYGSGWSVISISPDTQDTGIWDPGETATLAITLDPVLERDRTGIVSVGTPEGISDSAYLECHSNYFFHYETSTVAATTYYQLQKNVEADSSGATTTASFSPGQTGRVRPSPNDGKLVYPLSGLSSLPSSDWTVTYRVRRNDTATSTLSGTKIAFKSDRDGNSEIYVVDQDGANVTNLSNNAASDDRPSWSPDGLRLAFASDRDGNWEVYVMDVDGANQTNLTSNAADDRYPAWSPDGSKIAFYSYRDGNWEVYSMNVDGSSSSNLTNNAANDSYPAWSPDGSKIAFHTDRDGNFEVYVMDANGSGQTNLTNNAAEDGAPAWSPATSTIAFRSKRDGNKEIYLMNGDGSSQTRLTNDSATDVDPSWSPDGTKIAFTSDSSGNYDPYTMNSDGSGQVSVASNAAVDSEAEWSPFLPSSHGFVWFTTVRDISLAATGAWHDIDLSSHVPSGATGAIVELVNTTTTDYNGMVRGKQDTRDYMPSAAYGEIEAETHRWQIVKLDRNRLIEGYTSSDLVDFKLLGYTVGSDPVYFDVPPDITPATTGAWATVDVSAYVDASTDGVVLLIDSTASADRDYAVREMGSGDSVTSYELEEYGSTMYVAGIDASDQFQVYVEDSSVKVYLVARTKGSVVYYGTDVAIADPTSGAWLEQDADNASVPASANGLIFQVANTDPTVDRKLGLRHGASTKDGNADVGAGTHFEAMSGLRDDNVWDEYLEDDALNVSIAAYTTLTPVDVHADLDVLIRQADGAVRSTIATDVADSRSVTESGWHTVTADFHFPGYTVVDTTDYLEVDLFADAERNEAANVVALAFRIDDDSLPLADQSHIREDVQDVPLFQIEQYAASSTASSKYATGSWGPSQAIGVADTASCGDHPTAWAPESEGSGAEWLEVAFEVPVYARGLTVYETHNTGFITQIDLIDTNSAYHTIWTGTDNTACPGEFMLSFAKTSYKVAGMKIYTQMNGWEEIDAVKLLGDSDLAPGTLSEHAISATASSEFDVAGWSAMQAAGFPDTPSCDDAATAWAPESTSAGSEWLETWFRLPLYATGVTVYETHNAGFITQVDLIDVNGNYNTIWTGSDSTTCPGEFSITFSQTSYKVEGVRIHSAKSGWEEIDAVKLTGQFTGL